MPHGYSRTAYLPQHDVAYTNCPGKLVRSYHNFFKNYTSYHDSRDRLVSVVLRNSQKRIQYYEEGVLSLSCRHASVV